MSDSILLQTKFLIPQRSQTHLSRQSLVAKISATINKQRIMVIAPAGYGKTSLLIEVAEQLGDALTWIQLDEGDNDPATFMAYIMEGLARQAQELAMPSSSEDPIVPARLLVILLNQLLEQGKSPLTLILDDYHVIHNPIVHQLLTTLLDNLPPQMRVIIASRTTPVLPLSRWRARNQLLELRAGQLRFSTEETQSWLSQQSYDLSENLVSRLIEKTEGWGAGLQLVTALLQESDDQASVIGNLTGTQPYIFDYLMEEVFGQQSADIQSFLLRSSVFSELNPETCASVLDIASAAEILKSLEKNSLFISRLDTQQQWYRYHQLFSDFLLSKFKAQYPEDFIATQVTAGQHFAESGQSDKAIQHFIAAGDEILAAKMLCDFADTYLVHGRVDEIQTYLNYFSSETMRDFPHLMLLQGRILRHNGQFGAAIKRFEDALGLSADISVLCHAYIELAAIRHSQGRYDDAYALANEAMLLTKDVSATDYVYALMQMARGAGFIKGMDIGRQLAEQAYEIMQAEPEQFTTYARARLLQMLGQICWWHGDAHMAIEYCQHALTFLDDSDTPLRAKLLITLATPTLYQKDYDTALQLAEKAISICQEIQLKETLPAAYATLGNVLTRIGAFEQAESALQTAIQQADAIGGARYAQVMAAGYLAQNLALQGRLIEARQLAEQALIPYENQPVVYDVYVCRSVLADLLLDTRQLGQAKQIYSSLIDIGETTQYRIPLAMAYFGLAYILMQEDNSKEAMHYSQQSLKLLEPAMMQQLYLDQHERALLICQALVQHMPDNNFVRQIYQLLSETLPEPQLPIITITRPESIEIRTLGGFTVLRDAELIESKSFASAKARDLLAYFVTLRSKSVNLDRAIDAIWSDGSGSTSGFHTALYRVRAALRRKGEKDKFILSEVGEYHLDTARFDVDVDRFYSLLKRARHAEGEQVAELYEAALGLYQGDYLDNLYYEWVIIERESLQREFLTAITHYTEWLVADSQYHRAANWLHKALELEPYDEHLHITYMQTLHHMGQQQNIIAHYHELTTLLDKAFGAEPMPETQSAYQKLVD